MSDSPRIYVACLAAYNNGKLHGEWIDAAQEPDALYEEINAMLAKSPEPGAEEFAIHDYEGFHGLQIGEYESTDRVSKLALFLEEHEEAGAAYINHVGLSYALDDDNLDDSFRDAYAGTYDSKEDWAEEFLSDTGALSNMPENLRMYFDFEAYARDVDMNGDMHFEEGENGKVYVFHNC